MTSLRAILFDLGGTLVEDAGTPGARIAAAAGDAALAGAIDALVLRRSFATPDELAGRLAKELGLASAPVAAVTDLWDEAARPAAAVAEATTCVLALRAAGARIGLVANLWTPAVHAVRVGVPNLVAAADGWFASCELGQVKPGAGILHLAFSALEVQPEHVLVVGDDLVDDVAPAIAIGASAVWLRRGEAAGGVVAVDPHGAPFPIPADAVPDGAVVARSLSDVRRIGLTWLWAGRGRRSGLTGPLAV